MVRTISLSDGKKMPAMAWGNGTRGIEHSGQRATDLGAMALQEGIMHIDTAKAYGTEKETGDAIRAAGVKRERIWVTTKMNEGKDSEGRDQDRRPLDQIRSAVEDSIAKLGFLPDLYLVHHPFIPRDGEIAKFWQVLEDLVLDGTLKGCSLGVSNFRPQDIESIMEVARIQPVCNQLEYHPYALAHLDPVMATHAKYGIATAAYGPLQPLVAHPTGGPVKPILTEIAKIMSEESGTEVDAASVLLLWTVGKGAAAITTSSNPINIKKMAATEKLRDLTPTEMQQIDEAGRKVHFKGWAGHMSVDYPKPNLPEDV